MKKIIIYDDNCGICSLLIKYLAFFNNSFSIIGFSNADELLNQYNIEVETAEKSVVVVLPQQNKCLIEAEAIFEIIADVLKLSNDEKLFLFSENIIKFFNPIYRYIAKRRRQISIFFGLNACKILRQ